MREAPHATTSLTISTSATTKIAASATPTPITRTGFRLAEKRRAHRFHGVGQASLR
jgi:hypothetical protein